MWQNILVRNVPKAWHAELTKIGKEASKKQAKVVSMNDVCLNAIKLYLQSHGKDVD